MDKLKAISASAQSATATVIAVVAITVGAELSAPFKNWLSGFSGHHWVTKSWISILIFFIFFFIFRLTGKPASAFQTRKALYILQATAILGFFAILGFYIYEFLKH